jgi:glycine/D-amino acid oxidase-like deaminating enzyme
MSSQRDVDWVVIGSGFGGSVAALRLAQKGYSVRVLESGWRFRDQDFARSTWDARRYFFAPRLGLRGIMRLTPFPDVLIASGAGVGGGSLGYANTLYRARDSFFEDPRWRELADWKAELAAHYDTAERMLGVSNVTFDSDGDILLRELAGALGVEDTYGHMRVGVYREEPGVKHPDPYFDGEGPARSGCLRCGECMVGCRHGAKNTLVKNYLWFAERRGVRIVAEQTVTDVRPLGAADGAEGYAVTHVRSGALRRGRGERITARGVVLAAGALGTNRLAGRLPAWWFAAARVRSPRAPGADEQRVDRRGHRARRHARLHRLGGDQLEHLPGSRHGHRAGDLRSWWRRDEDDVHRAGGRWHAGHPAAAVAGRDRPPPRQLRAPGNHAGGSGRAEGQNESLDGR